MGVLFAEQDAPTLKKFIMNKVQNASEADPDVLSDYILALLRHDQSVEEIMDTCITQLVDFLTGGNFSLSSVSLFTRLIVVDPQPFVRELFEALVVRFPLNGRCD